MKTRHGFNKVHRWLLGLCLVLSGCSADFGYVDPGTTPDSSSSAAWLTIDPVYPNTNCGSFVLEGDAFISPTYWHCCGGSAAEMTAVTVTWRNETTGESGGAAQTVQYGSLYPLYNHRWRATVSLAPGSNNIAVTAADPKISAVRRIAIGRSGVSLVVSGHLRNTTGVGIGTTNSGLWMKLIGPRNMIGRVDPVNGYRFDCLTPGGYTATTSNNVFDYVFTPAHQDFVLDTQNVILPDMLAPAYRIFGQVWYAGTGLPAAATSLQISRGTQVVPTTSDDNGNYEFVVPNGSYRIESPGDSISPSYQEVTVSDADAPAVNFTRLP